MKISVIGAGNVGGLAAMRIAQMGLGEVCLIDIAAGLAQGKALDMEDSQGLVKINYNIKAGSDYSLIKGSDIVVVTAGLARKPGMTREDLLNKNAAILKEVCLQVKAFAPDCVLIIVTNPLDIMSRLALAITGFKPAKVFGMGITLDAGRFANLISKETGIPVSEIEACVIGSHGEGMMPLASLTKIKGVALDEFLSEDKISSLITRTIERGKEIVSLLGSGSAYFAPSAAIAELVRVIAKDEKKILGVSVYLNGEYVLKDVYLGLPCRLGKSGIEKIIQLDLEDKDKQALANCAEQVKKQYSSLGI